MQRIADICQNENLNARKFQTNQNHRYEEYESQNLIDY